MFSDPKYIFPVCQKKIFLIQSKVNIFHQIQPNYNTMIWLVCGWITLNTSHKIQHSISASEMTRWRLPRRMASSCPTTTITTVTAHCVISWSCISVNSKQQLRGIRDNFPPDSTYLCNNRRIYGRGGMAVAMEPIKSFTPLLDSFPARIIRRPDLLDIPDWSIDVRCK